MPSTTKNKSGLLDTWGRRNRRLKDKVCAECGNLFHPLRTSSKYCSNPCRWANNGGHNKKKESWWINSKGYVEGKIWIDEHTQIQVKKQRWIMEQHLGRKLKPNEDVHHINEIKTDNRLSNLELLTHGEHTTLHNKKRKGQKHKTKRSW